MSSESTTITNLPSEILALIIHQAIKGSGNDPRRLAALKRVDKKWNKATTHDLQLSPNSPKYLELYWKMRVREFFPLQVYHLEMEEKRFVKEKGFEYLAHFWQKAFIKLVIKNLHCFDEKRETYSNILENMVQTLFQTFLNKKHIELRSIFYLEETIENIEAEFYLGGLKEYENILDIFLNKDSLDLAMSNNINKFLKVYFNDLKNKSDKIRFNNLYQLFKIFFLKKHYINIKKVWAI